MYVEVPARPGIEKDGAKKEAVNLVVSRHLGITLEQASDLVRLGAVWMYEDYDAHDWERVVQNEFIDASKVLRVFPNPDRHKTCYVEDWRERVKKVDPDFVVVDKPPLLPCFSKACNGRESLGQCLREGLHVRRWGGDSNPITEDFTPCHELDEEATGIVALARHEAALEAFTEWESNRKVIFEYVALTTAMVQKGTYRCFYNKSLPSGPGAPLAPLYWEIPSEAIKKRWDYDSWGVVDMDVVATAELPGGCAAVRIRTYGNGREERIRAQLAMLGAPVLNDRLNEAVTQPKRDEVIRDAGLLLDKSTLHAPGGVSTSSSTALSTVTPTGGLARVPITAVVDDETLLGPYGHKLTLLDGAQDAADQGIPLTNIPKSPVALHLARLEFGGRVVTCAPPAWWPEGAAAAVAVKLTVKDIKENIFAFLTTHGGRARLGAIGGRFGVKAQWLEEMFPVDRPAGLVFASEDAKKEWESEVRIKNGQKAWDFGMIEKDRARKERTMRLRETYLTPEERTWKKTPRFKEIKKGKVKPLAQR